jgi:recombinational DNA repair protein RecT
MPKNNEVVYKDKGLNNLLANLKTNLVTKVGIFADENNNREDGEITNSELGAIHEFGSITKNIRIRSFLRSPLELKRKKLINNLKNIIAANITKKNGKEKIFELIGIDAYAIIQEAFETGGYGTWEPIAIKTAIKKGSSKILIDSSDLRKSIIYKVEKLKK